MPTKQQIQASLSALAALAEAIRALGSVPSGHLYAQVMGHMDEATYASFISRLKGAGLVTEKANLLTWVGPVPGDGNAEVK